MQLGELLRKRLRIALGAVHNDPAAPDSLKSALAVVSQCLAQQWSALAVAEAELAGKVGEDELRGGLALKLSVREFLGYFQKIEAVVEKMEDYWAAAEAKTKDLIDHRITALSQQLMQLDQNARNTTSHLRNELEQLRHDLPQPAPTPTPTPIPNDKLQLVLAELRQLQLHFSETQQQTTQLMQQLTLAPPKSDPQVLSQLAALQQHLQLLPPPAHRLLWQWRPLQAELRWENAGGLSASEWGGAVARRAGMHKVAVGYLAEEGASGELGLVVDEREVRVVGVEGEAGQEGLCRATMLFLYLRAGSSVKLQLRTNCPLSGFLLLEGF